MALRLAFLQSASLRAICAIMNCTRYAEMLLVPKAAQEKVCMLKLREYQAIFNSNIFASSIVNSTYIFCMIHTELIITGLIILFDLTDCLFLYIKNGRKDL